MTGQSEDEQTRQERGRRFLDIMKRYCIDYVNVGDQGVTKDIMVEDYVLYMGPHRVTGRDGSYYDATRKQMVQYPGLMLTVHEIATSGDRLMMRFSEHGRRASDGRFCVWGGISLYEWNGEKLIDCRVEQDYMSRMRQIENGVPDLVDHPAVAPWHVDAEAPDIEAEDVVRDWLEAGQIGVDRRVACDAEWQGTHPSPVIEQQEIEILSLFSAGSKVAFHALQKGRPAPDFAKAMNGSNERLYSTGIIHVGNGAVQKGRIIRNRLEFARG